MPDARPSVVNRVHTGPGNPGISWKMKSVLESGFMSLNILEKPARVRTHLGNPGISWKMKLVLEYSGI